MSTRVIPVVASMTVLVAFLPWRAANAQQVRPPIEVALGVSRFAHGGEYEGAIAPRDATGPDVRVTFPISPRYAVEEIVSFARGPRYQTPAYQQRAEGFILSTQVKRQIDKWTAGGFQSFLLFGAAGYLQKERVDFPAPVRTSAGFVTSQTTDQFAMYGVLGVGVQQRIGKRVAVRADGTVLVGVVGTTRASASVSVPLGGYK